MHEVLPVRPSARYRRSLTLRVSLKTNRDGLVLWSHFTAVYLTLIVTLTLKHHLSRQYPSAYSHKEGYPRINKAGGRFFVSGGVGVSDGFLKFYLSVTSLQQRFFT